MATKMKKDNILVIGVNNIGVSIAVLLKRLGYSFFVSSTNSMKLRLFKEGLTPIVDKDLKTLYINENVSPKFIEHIDKQNDVVFVCEDNFNIVKFLEHNEVTFLVINILMKTDELEYICSRLKEKNIIYWPYFSLEEENIIGVTDNIDLYKLYDFFKISSFNNMSFYSLKTVNEYYLFKKDISDYVKSKLNEIDKSNILNDKEKEDVKYLLEKKKS